MTKLISGNHISDFADLPHEVVEEVHAMVEAHIAPSPAPDARDGALHSGDRVPQQGFWHRLNGYSRNSFRILRPWAWH